MPAINRMRLIDRMRLDEIAAEIRTKQQKIDGLARSVVETAVEIGESLRQAKELVPHGGWAQYVGQECRFTPRMANNYLRLSKWYLGLSSANRKRASDLPLRRLLDEASERAPEALPPPPAPPSPPPPASDPTDLLTAEQAAHVAQIGQALGAVRVLADENLRQRRSRRPPIVDIASPPAAGAVEVIVEGEYRELEQAAAETGDYRASAITDLRRVCDEMERGIVTVSQAITAIHRITAALAASGGREGQEGAENG